MPDAATLALFVAVGLCTDGLYALLGSAAGDWMRRASAGIRKGGHYVSGGTYLALGAAAAAPGSGKD